MIASALASAFAGMAALCFATDRHHRQLGFGAPSPGARTALRLAGCAGSALALVSCVAHWGWSMGFVAWIGTLSVAGLCLVPLVAYAPRGAAVLALAATPLAALPILLRF